MKNFLWVRRKIIAVMVITGAVTWFTCNHFKVSLTHSLVYRFFWISTGQQQIANISKDSYVTYYNYVPAPINRVMSEIKRIGCVAGEKLTVDDHDDYYCNGEFIAHAKRKSLFKTDLTPFRFDGKVPEGMYFTVGDHRDSYDSRYYGFVAQTRIKERAWPIF